MQYCYGCWGALVEEEDQGGREVAVIDRVRRGIRRLAQRGDSSPYQVAPNLGKSRKKYIWRSVGTLPKARLKLPIDHQDRSVSASTYYLAVLLYMTSTTTLNGVNPLCFCSSFLSLPPSLCSLLMPKFSVLKDCVQSFPSPTFNSSGLPLSTTLGSLLSL